MRFRHRTLLSVTEDPQTNMREQLKRTIQEACMDDHAHTFLEPETFHVTLMDDPV